MNPEAAVERAYEVFARYGLPPVLDYCTHCHSESDEKRLHAPLRTLSPDTVRVYVWDRDAPHRRRA